MPLMSKFPPAVPMAFAASQTCATDVSQARVK